MDHFQLQTLVEEWKKRLACKRALELDPSIVSFERPNLVEEWKKRLACKKALELDPSIVSFERPKARVVKEPFTSYASLWYGMAQESLAQKQSGRPMRPTLAVNGLVQAPSDFSPSSSTASPSRADATKNMFKTMRPLPLRHIWQFWSDKSEYTTPPLSYFYFYFYFFH
jgi:hypothetical protein